MVAVDLLRLATEWGTQVVQAARNKQERRAADTVEKSSILVAGLQHMDQRFTELFVPLVFYDPGSWPIERRRTWAEDALGFIHGDRVVDRLGQAIVYLESSPIDDRQLAALVQDLCDITHAALWGSVRIDVQSVGVGEAQEGREPTTWADSTRHWNQEMRSALGPPGERRGLDPDDAVAPAVAGLVALMRADDPDPQQVARAASACLVVPRDIGPRDYATPTDPSGLQYADPYRPARLEYGAVWQLDSDPDSVEYVDPNLAGWPAALNTVSPLRDYADNAGRRFQQILAVMRASFPGLPEPSWLWGRS